MPLTGVLGLRIAYEVLGDAGAPAIVLTPGGRSSFEAPGIRELGQLLADGGKRVLLWDRPNCGQSDVALDAASEGQLAAAVLCELVRTLELGPTALAAGSGGARISLEAAVAAPELFSHLVVWWVAGGDLSLRHMAYAYCVEPAMTVNVVGMAGLERCASWAEVMAQNPRARATLLAQDPQAFIAVMRKWSQAFEPSPDSPVPGLSAAQLEALALPLLILRNSPNDLSHPAEVTDRLHRLIPASALADPPWGEGEWNARWAALLDGTGRGLFEGWPALAETILAFTGRQREPQPWR